VGWPTWPTRSSPGRLLVAPTGRPAY